MSLSLELGIGIDSVSGKPDTPEVKLYTTGLSTPLSASFKNKLNTLVNDIKTYMSISNLSDAFELLYILAGETDECSRKNLAKDSYHLTKQSTPTFTTLKGWKGATGKYLKTGFIPKSNVIVASKDSYSHFAYIRESIETNVVKIPAGVFSQSPNTLSNIIPSYASKVDCAVNGLACVSNYKQNYAGFYGGVRNSSSVVTNYVNYLKANASVNSVDLPSRELFVLARNNVGTADAFYDKEVSMFAASKGLTETQVYGFFKAFEKFMVSLSNNVLHTSVAIVGDSIADINTTTFAWPSNFVQTAHTIASYAVTGHSIISNMAIDCALITGNVYDKIIVALGTNDNDVGNMTTLQNTYESGISAIKTANPNATIYCMNVLPRWTDATGSTPIAKGNIRTAISAACLSQGVTCWDTFNTPWIIASDTVDGTHPSFDGAIKIYNEVLSRI